MLNACCRLISEKAVVQESMEEIIQELQRERDAAALQRDHLMKDQEALTKVYTHMLMLQPVW